MLNQSDIRNFVIISHIDHGKSTLADRFLELTGTIDKRKMREQYLDMMDLEREKGITIKLQPVRMLYNLKSNINYLNLIDPPGHVDFSYEVSRSLAAVEGAILLVDATQGIQAQTLANLYLAQKQNLVIIPAVNKIDLREAQIEESKNELSQLLKVSKEEIFEISAKLGTNVDKLLTEVIKKFPPPQGNPDTPLRALVFDSKYDSYKGVISFIRIVDGKIKKGEKIKLMASGAEDEVREVGYFEPELSSSQELSAGEIGYIATGIKEPGKVRAGDTITISNIKNQISKIIKVGALPGYKEPMPMVFASFFPEKGEDFELLKDAFNKLKLNDASLFFEQEVSEALGRGFKCGFLGTLHMEIVFERLKREFGAEVILTAPSVLYKIKFASKAVPEYTEIYSASQMPERNEIGGILEPWAKLEIITPQKYLSQLINLVKLRRGRFIETKYLGGENRLILVCEIPLSEIISDFYTQLKNLTSGYASLNYELIEWRSGDLVKLNILVAGENIEAFSRIVHKDTAYQEGKNTVGRLKEILPSQLFAVALQAEVDGRVVARETMRALRKDVTGYLYGGDYTRKRKLLEKQKKGKKLLKERGKVNIPPEVFLKILKK